MNTKKKIRRKRNWKTFAIERICLESKMKKDREMNCTHWKKKRKKRKVRMSLCPLRLKF
jgi:hypothetical protein